LTCIGRVDPYMKLNVRRAYNLLQVKVGNEHLLDVRMRNGLFEPTVMQFGSTNPLVDFQRYINYTIKEDLGNIESAYLDDILIHSDLNKEHVNHIRWILQCLLTAGLHLKPERFVCHNETISYLRLIITTNVILAD
jgi:aconitase A